MDIALHESKSTRAIQTNKRTVLYLCITMGVLLSLRAVSNVFIYPAVLFGVAAVLFSKPSTGLCLMFFTLPMAPIFKMSPDQFSFFMVMLLVLALKLIFTRKISPLFLISILAMGCYFVVFSGMGKLVTIGTMVLGMMLVYYSLRDDDVDTSDLIIAYSAGILLSAVLGMLRMELPIIQNLVGSTDVMVSGTEISRFYGLHGNPNYFTLDITMAIAGLAVFMAIKKKMGIYSVFFVVLSAIGMMSVSNSFLITFFVLLVWMVISFAQINVSRLVKYSLVLVCFAVVITAVMSDTIFAYASRLLGGGSLTLSELTTGRTDIWGSYITEIVSNFKVLVVGNGLDAVLDTLGAHNTYIELVFMLGLAGGAIYLVSLLQCFVLPKKKMMLIFLAPLVVCLVRLIAIGILTYDSIWFYYIIIGIFIKAGSAYEAEK